MRLYPYIFLSAIVFTPLCSVTVAAQSAVVAAPAPSPKVVAKPPKYPAGSYLQDVCSLSAQQCVRSSPEPGHPFVPIQAPALAALVPVTQSCSPELTSGEGIISSTTVKTQLGTVPAPFSIQTVGPYIYIYSTDYPLTAGDKQLLSALEKQIGAVLVATTSFQVELPILHAATLGNFVASLTAAAPSGLTITSASATSIRLASDGTVSCDSIKRFLRDLRKFENHTTPDAPVASVFYLDPAATGTALNATAVPFAAAGVAALSPAATTSAPASSTGGGGGAAATTSGSTAASPASSSGGGTNAGGSTAPATTGASSTPSSGTATASTITIATTTTSAATPTTKPGATPAASNPPTTTTTITTTPPAAAAPSPTPVSPASSTTAPTTTAPSAPPFSVNGRDLLFGGGTPGDDGWITEKKRALALLDLPQPQVLVNAWVMQSSASKATDSGKLTNLVHEAVNVYNDAIQLSLYFGWQQLRRESARPSFFDPEFYNYITLRTVSDSRTGDPATPATITQAQSQGICPPGQYCLGYSSMFQPSEPRLTDMLLTLLAAAKPEVQANEAIDAMDTTQLPEKSEPKCGLEKCVSPLALSAERKKKLTAVLFSRDINQWSPQGCETADEQKLLEREEKALPDQRLPLECFRVAMNTIGSAGADSTVSELGLIRAALADFLFNYKLSQQYPHEFAPYDLTASAQRLDASLAPFIHAFNEDLQAFQTFLRAQLVVKYQSMKISGDKNTFLNDGIVTVQTTSGDTATVSTATQSFLNVSKAPSVSQLLSSIAGTSPGGQASGPLTGVLGNISFNQAQVLMGALAAYQTTSLNVGRQLNLVVKPRSLLGASAAEMDVQLNADQTPNSPNYWTPGSSGGAGVAADLSQVTQHDITTHVRIDSIRLFEISSFTAVLSKGRDKFPLLPPFVEIPYIGTLLGIPLPAAREYHTSSAVVSAVIVPTATDIAYSLRFIGDRVIVGDQSGKNSNCMLTPTMPHWSDANCVTRRATSLLDLNKQPIFEFHRMKLYCIATMGGAPFPTGISSQFDMTIPRQACTNLSFADVMHDVSE